MLSVFIFVLFLVQVYNKLGKSDLALLNFSWARDFSPAGTLNRIKDTIANYHLPDDDDDGEGEDGGNGENTDGEVEDGSGNDDNEGQGEGVSFEQDEQDVNGSFGPLSPI
jgi:hypothetical protein